MRRLLKSLCENRVGEGDSPILLRGLRKIGTVPDAATPTRRRSFRRRAWSSTGFASPGMATFAAIMQAKAVVGQRDKEKGRQGEGR